MSIDRAKIQEAAQKYVTKGQYDKAIVEYQKLIKADPADARSWQQIATYYQRLDKKKEAIDSYKKVSSIYAQQGFFDKAVAVQKLILSIEPLAIDAHLALVDLHQRLGLVRNAVSGLEQIAAIYAKNGDGVRALAMLEKMVDLEPDSVPSRIKYAEALSKAERADEAAAAFEGGAKLLKQQGRMDDYIKVSERLLFHRPEDHERSRELAKLYLERNDAKRALAKLQVVFKAEPKDIHTLEMLATAFHSLGQLPKTVSVYKELARIHADGKRVDQQKRVLQRVLELDPGDQEAKQELALLANTRPPDSLKRLTGMNLPPAAVISAARGAGPKRADSSAQVRAAPPRPPPEPTASGRIPARPEPTASGRVMPPPPVASRPVAAPASRAAAPIKNADPMDADIIMVDDESDLEVESVDHSASRSLPEERTMYEPQREENTVFGTSLTAEAERTVFGESNIPAVLGGDVPEEAPLGVRVAKLMAECDVFARYGLTHKIADQLRTVLTLDPLHREARHRLIDLLEAKGDAEGSVLELEVLLEQTEGRDESQQYAERILALDPDHQEAQRVAHQYAPAEQPAPFAADAGANDDAIFFVDSEPPAARAKSAPKMPAAGPSRTSVSEDSAPSIDVLGARGRGASAAASMPRHTAMLLGEDLPDTYGIGQPVKAPPATRVLAPEPLPSSPFDSFPALAEDRSSALDIPIAPDEFDQGLVQVAAPTPASASTRNLGASDIEDVLDEVDFYLAQGLVAEARVMLEDALRNAPDHPLLLDKLQELPEARARTGTSAETAAMLERPIDDSDLGLGHSSMRPESTALTNVGAMFADDDAPSLAASLGLDSHGASASDRTFDLAEKLADEFDAVDMEASSMGAVELDVEQVFAQFKKGVREQVGLEDSETHFDLGIAYREMDLLSDAIAEFQLCLTNPLKACAAHSMIGLCQIARGDTSEAISSFKKGLYVENRTELEEISLYYDLGFAYEKLGDIKEAIFYLEKVKKRDPGYREVAEKLSALMTPEAAPTAKPTAQEDDIDAAFDDLFKD